MDQGYLCEFGCGRRFPDKEAMAEHIKRRHSVRQPSQPQKSAQQLPKLGPGVIDQQQKVTARTMVKVLRPKLPASTKSEAPSEEIDAMFRDSRIDFKNPPNPKAVAKQQLMKDGLIHKKIIAPLRSSSIQKENTLGKPPIIMKRPTSSKVFGDVVPSQIQPTFEHNYPPAPSYTTNDILENKKKLTKQLIFQHGGYEQLDKITHLILRQQDLIVFESTREVPFKEMLSLKSLSLSHNRLINIIGVSELRGLLELNVNNNQISDLSPLSACKMLQRLWCNHNCVERLAGISPMIHLEVFAVSHNRINDFSDIQRFLKHCPSLRELEIQGNPCAIRQEYKYDLIWESFLEKLDGQDISDQDYLLAKAFQENKSGVQQRPQTAPEETVFQDDDDAQSEMSDLEQALNEAYLENHVLRERVSKLEDLNQTLAREAERIPYLETEIQELRAKCSAYETMLILKESPEDELRKEVMRLTSELAAYKKESEMYYGDPVKEMLRETVSTFKQPKEEDAHSSEISDSESDSNKYFIDDANEVTQQSQELMELIMRNSMTLSQMKSELRSLPK